MFISHLLLLLCFSRYCSEEVKASFDQEPSGTCLDKDGGCPFLVFQWIWRSQLKTEELRQKCMKRRPNGRSRVVSKNWSGGSPSYIMQSPYFQYTLSQSLLVQTAAKTSKQTIYAKCKQNMTKWLLVSRFVRLEMRSCISLVCTMAKALKTMRPLEAKDRPMKDHRSIWKDTSREHTAMKDLKWLKLGSYQLGLRREG